MSYDPYSRKNSDDEGENRRLGNPWQKQSSVPGALIGGLLRNPRILAALGLAVVAFFMYFSGTHEAANPFTGEKARLALSPEQEVAMGKESVPHMLEQFGGELDPRSRKDAIVLQEIDEIGARLLAAKERILKKRGVDDFDYPFEFHVLADEQTINAFALPGGQVFITKALLAKLPDDDAVAGVLGHEIGHVLAWHSNKQMAKDKLLSGLVNAAVVATSDGTRNNGQIAQMVGQLVRTKYGRRDESQSDRIGVQLMIEAGYRPDALLEVMKVLQQSMKGPRPPEMLSSHPFPETRAKRIEEYIAFFTANGAHADWTGGEEE